MYRQSKDYSSRKWPQTVFVIVVLALAAAFTILANPETFGNPLLKSVAIGAIVGALIAVSIATLQLINRRKRSR